MKVAAQDQGDSGAGASGSREPAPGMQLPEVSDGLGPEGLGEAIRATLIALRESRYGHLSDWQFDKLVELLAGIAQCLSF